MSHILGASSASCFFTRSCSVRSIGCVPEMAHFQISRRLLHSTPIFRSAHILLSNIRSCSSRSTSLTKSLKSYNRSTRLFSNSVARSFTQSAVASESLQNSLKKARAASSNSENTLEKVRVDRKGSNEEELDDVDHLEDRWRYYSEDGGVPLPNGDLEAADIETIFGSAVDPETANHVLHVLQWRRESGALAEKGVSFPDGLELPQQSAMDALEYLRETYPMDEEGAAVEWAETAAREIEEEMYRRGVDSKLYAAPSGEEESVRPPAHDIGVSVLEQHRREVAEQEKILEEEKKLQAPTPEQVQVENQRAVSIAKAEGLAELSETFIGKGLTAADYEKIAKNRRWKEERAKEAELNDGKEIPPMSMFQRLMPSLLLSTIALAAFYLLAQSYTPPSLSGRLFPDIPPALSTCLALLAINTSVFVTWRLAPSLWKYMNRYLLIVPAWPHPIGIIGNIFSHHGFSHLFFNMLVIMVVGPNLHELVGRGEFLNIYMSSGVVGSFASLAYLVGRGMLTHYSMGASTAAFGIVGALCILSPIDHLRIPLPGLSEYQIPFSGPALIAVLAAIELFSIVFRKTAVVSHASHVGGVLWGAGYAWFLKRRYEKDEVPLSPLLKSDEESSSSSSSSET